MTQRSLVASSPLIHQLRKDAKMCEVIASRYPSDPLLAQIAFELAADMKRAADTAPLLAEEKEFLDLHQIATVIPAEAREVAIANPDEIENF
jgi:hypothetical protein